MKKLKEAWKGMTKREKTLIIVRDMACFCFLLVALLTTLGLVPHGTPIAWLLPAVCCLAMSYVIEPVFKAQTENKEEDNNADPWYNE